MSHLMETGRRKDDKLTVADTNWNAVLGKLSAIKNGYYTDHFLKLLINQNECEKIEKSSILPEMNHGYYIRTIIIRKFIEEFLKKQKLLKIDETEYYGGQIVNLGCGSDSIYWNLMEKEICPIHFIDIDQRSIVRSKERQIVKENLTKYFIDGKFSLSRQSPFRCGINSKNYSLIPIDLVDNVEMVKTILEKELDRNLPTLFISECFFTYLENDNIIQLHNIFQQCLTNISYLIYDIFNLDNKFGENMLKNLKMNNHLIFSSEKQSILKGDEIFVRNYLKKILGKENIYFNNMKKEFVDIGQMEIERLRRLQQFDEQELLFELLTHYYIAHIY
ncbi:hypothetical protein SNEBB_005044 [Seison nebaliae]|nr:hypothetical protein SNEBB_005044 [Seison nebaliae]